jgi:hypothetical protein
VGYVQQSGETAIASLTVAAWSKVQQSVGDTYSALTGSLLRADTISVLLEV